MFHNYFFLKRLAEALDKKLTGLKLLECFSQNRDELILGFGAEQDQLFIKANLTPQVSLIDIVDDFKRARKNSVDLFSDLIDLSVTGIQVIPFDRSFQILLDYDHVLIFKLHGSRSNILHVKNNQVLSIFRGVLEQDLAIIPSELGKTQPDHEFFNEVDGNPVKYLPALGKEVRSYLNNSGYNEANLDAKWTQITETIASLYSNPITITPTEPPSLSLLEPKSVSLDQYEDPIEALQKFYREFTRQHYLNDSRGKLLKELDTKIQKTENYITKSKQKLEEVENQRGYDEIANIIMANLHVFQSGVKEAKLLDFYTNQELLVKIKANTTPQKHAENLYRKSKNQKIEINKLKENIAERESILDQLKQERENILSETDFRNLSQFRKESNKKQAEETSHPFHNVRISGYEILVGKNARGNDEITTRIAAKNDLWLHAKDVSGSHVLIRNPSKQSIPSNVLESAAELAAWFSKRKTDSLCPVIYTEKKFVRKIKGAPAGAVKVDKESVIMVVPKNNLI